MGVDSEAGPEPQQQEQQLLLGEEAAANSVESSGTHAGESALLLRRSKRA